MCREVQHACADLTRVIVARSFHDARTQLGAWPPDALVTNLRLGDYNGLHLVLLARSANHATRCIVYSDRPDTYLVREAQSIGAFFERTDRLVHALPGYCRAALPSKDRRAPDGRDRRAVFRGGRRSVDQPVVV
jgi:response regulator of citrate/malate metabolism